MKPEWNGRAARPYRAEQWASSKNSKLMCLFFFNWSVRFAPPTARESHFPERKPALCVTITTTAKFSTHLCFFNVPSFFHLVSLQWQNFPLSSNTLPCFVLRANLQLLTKLVSMRLRVDLPSYELMVRFTYLKQKRKRSIKKNVKYSNTKRYTATCLRNA